MLRQYRPVALHHLILKPGSPSIIDHAVPLHVVLVVQVVYAPCHDFFSALLDNNKKSFQMLSS
jgi:hypothetical protein